MNNIDNTATDQAVIETLETDEISDEALDRLPGTGEASIYNTGGFSHPEPALRPSTVDTTGG
jgi:hypothetical protein